MSLKIKWYRSEIIERFMDKRQQEEFDKQYKQSKVINLGQRVLEVAKKERENGKK